MFEGDFVAKGFELADVGSCAPFGVDPGIEEVAAEAKDLGVRLA